jgi:hypothetical protein
MKTLRHYLPYFIGALPVLLALLVALNSARAIFVSSPQDPILTGDITTTEILNGTILGEDINSNTGITIATGTTTAATSTRLRVSGGAMLASTSVESLDVSGNARFRSNARFDSTETHNGVTYTLPSADGSANQALTTNGAGTLSWAAATASSIISTSTAGTELYSGKAVRIASTTATHNQLDVTGTGSDSTIGDNAARQKIAQSYLEDDTLLINEIAIDVKKVGTPSGAFRVCLMFDNSNTPNNTCTGTATLDAASITTSYAEYKFLLDKGIVVPAKVRVHAVMDKVGGGVDASNYYAVQNGSNTYSNGQKFEFDGSSWTADSSRELDTTLRLAETAGSAYYCDASVSTTTTACLGINNATASTSATVSIITAGEAVGVATTTGRAYYISSSGGEISDVAGTIARKIGIAIGSGRLVVTNIW